MQAVGSSMRRIRYDEIFVMVVVCMHAVCAFVLYMVDVQVHACMRLHLLRAAPAASVRASQYVCTSLSFDS